VHSTQRLTHRSAQPLLAGLPIGTEGCQAVPSGLVCRSMYGELMVWAYQQAGAQWGIRSVPRAGEGGVQNGLIELGEMSGAPQVPVTRARRQVPYRMLLGVLSLVLVVLLGGGPHRGPQEPPTVIPARLGDATFIDGDRLFVVSAGRPALRPDMQNRVVSAYTLPEGRLASRTTVAVSGEGVAQVVQAADTLLLSYPLDNRSEWADSGTWAVVAITAGTDRALWRKTGRLVGASAADGLVVLNSDEAELGVDLHTGEIRWSVPHPAHGSAAEAGTVGGFPSWLVTVTDVGRLETRDTRTGRVHAAVTVARLTGRVTGLVWPVGDIVLIDTGASRFAAFRLPNLTPLWHTSADLSQSGLPADCGRVLCTSRPQRGMTALDPATGRELWSSDRWAYARAAGPYLLATSGYPADDVPALSVLDPLTGRDLGNFGGWQLLGRSGRDGTAYGIWQTPGEDKIYYGVLNPATRGVRVLGSGQRVSTGCDTGAGVLVCPLIDASIAVWRLG
jgi:PQQ-like domain